MQYLPDFINNTYSFIPLTYNEMTSYIRFKNKNYTERFRKVAKQALTFLNFYAPAARYIFVASKLAEAHRILKKRSYETKVLRGIELLYVAGSIGSAITSVFSYREGLVVSLSRDLICSITCLANDIFNGKYRYVIESLPYIARDALCFVTVLTLSPRLLAISFAAQIAFMAFDNPDPTFKEKSWIPRFDFAIRIVVIGGLGYQFTQQARRVQFF